MAETHASAKVACIGPAGENGVLFASVMNDKDRAAGRSGVGTVMGAKNLKAVVVYADQKTSIADEDGFKSANKKFSDAFRKAAKDNPPPWHPGMQAREVLDILNIPKKAERIILINGQYSEPDKKLSPNDNIVLFPPMTGG